MSAIVRNRLLGLGALWGLSLAVVPALVMVEPLRPDGVLVVAVLCALLSGTVGTLLVRVSVCSEGGLLFGFIFGTLVNRVVRVGAEGGLR